MITKIIQEEKIQKANKYVEKGESFVIVTHVSPDGDALGSSLGLYHFLSAYGKDNVAVVVPNAFPSFYRWMPGAKDVVIHEKYPDFAEKLIKEADVIFCLDFNEPKRIEKTGSGGDRLRRPQGDDRSSSEPRRFLSCDDVVSGDVFYQ